MFDHQYAAEREGVGRRASPRHFTLAGSLTFTVNATPASAQIGNLTARALSAPQLSPQIVRRWLPLVCCIHRFQHKSGLLLGVFGAGWLSIAMAS